MLKKFRSITKSTSFAAFSAVPGLNGANFIYDINHLAYRSQLKGGVQSVVDDEDRKKACI